MPNASGARRGRTIWSAGFLSLGVCLGAGGGGLAAEQRLPAKATVSPAAAALLTTEVDLEPAPHDVLLRPGDPLNEALAGLGAHLDELARRVGKVRAKQAELPALKEQNQHLLARIEVLEAERGDAVTLAKELSMASDAASAKVRDLVEELIAERRNNAQLIAELTLAEAERAKIEQAARAKEAALVAWTRGLHDELAELEAQLAKAGATRAHSDARLAVQARVAEAERARAERAQTELTRTARQLAAMQEQLRERDRQMAAARTRSEDLRQRLAAAQAELKRQDADNERLIAELAAAHRAADLATVMVHESLAAIEDQIGVLHAAAGDAPPDLSKQSAMLAGVLPAMPYPKPRLEAGAVDAWLTAADAADGGAPAAAMAVIEDDPWIQASVREVAASAWEPTTDRTLLLAPDSPAIGDVISTAALLAAPPGPGRAGDSGAAEPSTPLLDWGDRAGLSEAAARLADGLRATREAAIFQRQERVFTVDVEQRAFAANPAAAPVPLDPALDIRLFTAQSELVGESEGGIRFYPDGSSTGGRIELELLGDRAALNVRWSTGVVTVER